MLVVALLSASLAAGPSPGPVTVRLGLPPTSTVLDLVTMADRLNPQAVAIPDPKVLAAQPVVVHADREVTPQTVWLAMRVALRINGWELTEDGATLTLAATSQLWFSGDRAVEILELEDVAVDALLRAIGAPEDDDLISERIGSTLIIGGSQARVYGYRQAVTAVLERPEVLVADGRLVCPANVDLGARSPLTGEGTVRMRFPPPASLGNATAFFCHLARFAAVVPDAAAFERQTVDLSADVDLSPAAAFQVYEHMLAVRGWALQFDGSLATLVHATPPVPDGEAAAVAVWEAAAGGIRAATDAGLRAEPIPGTRWLVVSGPSAGVAEVHRKLSER